MKIIFFHILLLLILFSGIQRISSDSNNYTWVNPCDTNPAGTSIDDKQKKVLLYNKCSQPASREDCYKFNLYYMGITASINSTSFTKGYCFTAFENGNVNYTNCPLDTNTSCAYLLNINGSVVDPKEPIDFKTNKSNYPFGIVYKPYDLLSGNFNECPTTSTTYEKSGDFCTKITKATNTDCPTTSNVRYFFKTGTGCVECNKSNCGTDQYCDVTNIVSNCVSQTTCFSQGFVILNDNCDRPRNANDCQQIKDKNLTYFDRIQGKCVERCVKSNFISLVISDIEIASNSTFSAYNILKTDYNIKKNDCISLEECYESGNTVSNNKCIQPTNSSDCKYQKKKYFQDKACIETCPSGTNENHYELENYNKLIKNTCVTAIDCTTNGNVIKNKFCVPPENSDDCATLVFQKAIKSDQAKCLQPTGTCAENYVTYQVAGDSILIKNSCILQSDCTDNGFIMDKALVPVTSVPPTKCLEPKSASDCVGLRQYFKAQNGTIPAKCTNYQECYLDWDFVVNESNKTCDQKCIAGSGLNLEEPDPNTKKICVKCSDKNCLECQDNYSTCTKCKDGYKTDNAKGLCLSCYIPQCKDCSVISDCSSCSNGYALTIDSGISGNSSSTTSATSGTKKCSKCTIDNCKTCNPDNLTICSVCQDKFYQYPPKQYVAEGQNFTECLIESESNRKNVMEYGEKYIGDNITTSTDLSNYMKIISTGFNNTKVYDEEVEVVQKISLLLATKFESLFKANDSATDTTANELISSLQNYTSSVFFDNADATIIQKVSGLFASTNLQLTLKSQIESALIIIDKIMSLHNIGDKVTAIETNILLNFAFIDAQYLKLQDASVTSDTQTYSKDTNTFNLEYQKMSYSSINQKRLLAEKTANTTNTTTTITNGTNTNGSTSSNTTESVLPSYDYFLSAKYTKNTQALIQSKATSGSTILFKRLALKKPLRPIPEKTLTNTLVYEIKSLLNSKVDTITIEGLKTDDLLEIEVPNNAEYSSVKLETLESTQFVPYYWSDNKWLKTGLKYVESRQGAIILSTSHLTEFIFVNELRKFAQFLNPFTWLIGLLIFFFL